MSLDFSKAAIQVDNDVEKETEKDLEALKYDVEKDKKLTSDALVDSKEVDD